MQLIEGSALTLTLSPRRGNGAAPRWEKSLNGGPSPTLHEVLPLLGERAGVRENVALPLNGSGKNTIPALAVPARSRCNLLVSPIRRLVIIDSCDSGGLSMINRNGNFVVHSRNIHNELSMSRNRLAAILLVMAMAWLHAMTALGRQTESKDPQRIKDEAAYKSFLALEPNKSYPTRSEASDPRTWKPVKFQAVTPTNGVTLDDTGVFKPVMEHNVDYLLKTCQVDQMLYYFRERAGQKPPDKDKPQFDWWERDLRGSCAGRYLLGAGNTLRWMENQELRTRMDELIDGIEACRDANGYILAFPANAPRNNEEPNYARTDFTQGLIAAGRDGNQKAYRLLRDNGDWFNQWELLPKLTYIDNGFQGHVASTQTYFTPVGKPEDMQAAERGYVIDHWMEQLTARDPEAIWKCFNHPHVFLIQGMEGYLDHYIATGDRTYLRAMIGGWDLYHDNWEHIGGSMAICESSPFPPKSYHLTAKGHTGENCGCVVWLEFNERFQQLFPMQEKYANEIEKTIYNVGLANQEPGKLGIRYHTVLEGTKANLDTGNTCCEVQGARLYGSLPEYIYSTAKDGLYVNLYEPSTIQCEVGGKPITLKMNSKFPFQPQVELKISTTQRVAMKLRVRVPTWASKDMLITVNEKKVVVGKPGTYAVLDRTWSDGDTIAFTLPMDFRVTRYAGADQIAGHERYALEYGPILMAAVGPLGKEIPVDIAHDPSRPHDWLTTQDQGLHFAIEGDSQHFIEPYWQVADQTFTCFPVIGTHSQQ